MAYNEHLKERIERVFKEKNVPAEGKTFMGGYCFFLNDKMCVGLDIDKNSNQDRLMARIGEENTGEALQRPGCSHMDITGKPMKGFVFVDPTGFDMDDDLEYWVQKSIDFNPFAKSSKKAR